MKENSGMRDAYICGYARTAIGRYGGALSSVRTDDLATVPIKALMDRHGTVDWAALDDVILGCTNQAGEDNRNVARMAALLSGLGEGAAGQTVNRLCGSGMEAVISAARAIGCGEGDLFIAGGVESMSRAPYVMPKPESAFSRQAEVYDSTIGWRFVNPKMAALFGIDSMGETAENLVDSHRISRIDQDGFAYRSQQKTKAAQDNGRLALEIVPVEVKTRKSCFQVQEDEHPRPDVCLDTLAALKPAFRKDGSVTAGNSAGVNDGAAALIIASKDAVRRHGLTPLARIMGGAVAGVAPRIMGIGPVPATRRLLDRLGLLLDNVDILELNEAFASQALAVLRTLGLDDDDPRVNPNGGAIALGHPLGMSGARLAGSLALELQQTGKTYGLATMCVGVGQGIALALERA